MATPDRPFPKSAEFRVPTLAHGSLGHGDFVSRAFDLAFVLGFGFIFFVFVTTFWMSEPDQSVGVYDGGADQRPLQVNSLKIAPATARSRERRFENAEAGMSESRSASYKIWTDESASGALERADRSQYDIRETEDSISALVGTIKRKTEDQSSSAPRKGEARSNGNSTFVSGQITSSFYAAGAKAGLSAREIKAFTDIFRHTVNFESDLRIGTRFELLFDEEGRSSKGDILYAKLINRENEIALYRGTDSVTGGAGYFDSAGRTNRRFLLRNPVDGARVSSHFGVRKHPILGYKKMHKGVDFAAEHGTPVIAAGDGVVEVLGRKGGFGNYVRLRHSNGYGSAYAHLSKFAKTLKSGDRVRQGDVIGYVGNTGRSTGSHLHFEILRHGKQVDPLSTLELDSVRELTGPSFRNFIDRVSWIEIALARMRQG